MRKSVDPVGPDVVTLRRLLEDYRRWLGFAPAPVIPIPAGLVRLGTWLGDRLGGPVNSTALSQLAFGNTGDFAAFERAVGFTPRRWRAALAQEPAHVQDRWHARLYFVRPFLRMTLAALWTGSALAGAFAIPAWAPMLAEALGIAVMPAAATLAVLCLCDLAIGAMLVLRRRPRLTAGLQVAMVGGYSLVATVLWPAMWAHPLGVLLKNLPILAAILALGAIEEDR